MQLIMKRKGVISYYSRAGINREIVFMMIYLG